MERQGQLDMTKSSPMLIKILVYKQIKEAEKHFHTTSAETCKQWIYNVAFDILQNDTNIAKFLNFKIFNMMLCFTKIRIFLGNPF